MRAVLTRLCAKKKVIFVYGLLLLGGWFLGDVLKELTIPEMRPMHEPMIHRIVMTAFVAFIVLAAIPFVPGSLPGKPRWHRLDTTGRTRPAPRQESC